MDFYHVLNRGVEKRNIVLNNKDRVRFLHDLFVFNDKNHALHISQPDRHTPPDRQPLVLIHAFCLMNNHYHLLLSELEEDGISRFMQKLNMGYTKYFNEKYNRVGTLWQGKYKRILVEQDAHFLYIPYYIHLNPLDYAMPEWREGKVRDIRKALAYLREYRWSSHLDYLGMKNFPSLTNRYHLLNEFKDPALYEKEIVSIITDRDATTMSNTIE